MLADNSSPQLPQLPLFDLEETRGSLELFPAVWMAMENLTAPEANTRHAALDRLLELSAPRFSAVVAYLLVTRIADPDLCLRKRIVEALGAILGQDMEGYPAPEEVRASLRYYLSQMRTRRVYAILQVADSDDGITDCAARLLDACPFAGNHLLEILNDQKAPLKIRKTAAIALGRVGYLDALPSLEKLQIRLEAKINGQKTMPFAAANYSDEAELLSPIQSSISILRTP